MGALRSSVHVGLVGLVGLAACGDLQGFGGTVPPLAKIQTQVTGTAPAGADLQVALVWGQQWLVEALCVRPPENAAAAAALTAGCRDPFGFVPARVAASVPATPGAPSELDLFSLPGADVLVGDLTARVAYGSLVVYDDRDHDGILKLGRPNRLGGTNGPPMMGTDLPTQLKDVVLGASFITMTAPDQRLAYREGVFSPVAAFYPRAGCGDPPPAFSVLAAGGFTAQAAIEATIAGMLPQEDPASCAESALADATITVPIVDPKTVTELACTERSTDSSVRYQEPDPTERPPDFTDRVTACVHLPSFGAPSDTIELIVAGRTDDSCVGLTHYVLKGCREDPACGSPDWDHSAAPPTWWPCGS